MNKINTTYHRPWGNYKTVYLDENMQIKIIEVLPKSRLSLQSHTYREEFWFIIEGKGKVNKNGIETYIYKGGMENIKIEKGDIHRMSNDTDEKIIFLEIQKGEYLGEDDIIRYEDDYGRN